MEGELRGNVFPLVGLPLAAYQSVAEGTKCCDVAAMECQVLLETDPGRILAGSFASQAVHGGGIVFDEGDSVAQLHLKRSEGTLLAPLVKHCLGFVKSPENHECLAGIGVVLSGRHRGMSDGPQELLQGLLRFAHLRIGDPQQVGGIHAAWVDLAVQKDDSDFLFEIAGDGRIIERGSLEILFLGETAILEVEGSLETGPRLLALAYAVLRSPELVVGGAKLGIEVDSSFKKRDGFPTLSGAVEVKPGAIGLQSLERTRGGKVKRRVKFLQRA